MVDVPRSSCRFSASIQPAVDAAVDGDVILVKSTLRRSFTIDGKSVCVIGVNLQFSSTCVVKNLRSDQSVVLRGLKGISLQLSNDRGLVWVEDCDWNGTCTDSKVAFVRSNEASSASIIPTRSTVIAYDSTFLGAEGLNADFSCGGDPFGIPECNYEYAGPGGPGLGMSGGAAFLFGCSLRGGPGGYGYDGYYYGGCEFCCKFCGGYPDLPGGCGGPALQLSFGAVATLMDTELRGGLDGDYSRSCNGPEVTGGTPIRLPGKTGHFRVDAPVLDGAPLHYTIQGPPGWRVFVAYSFEPRVVLDSPLHGVAMVPPGSPVAFLGTLPATGQMDVTRSFGNLIAPGSEARVVYVQLMLHDASRCYSLLGAPSALFVIENCP